MQVVELPDGFPEIPPGPVLAAVLAGLDLAQVANDDVVTVLRAQHRQVAHEQARLLAAVVEVARSTPFSDPEDPHVRALFGVQRAQAVQEWASGEIAAALTLTSAAADGELAFADTVVNRLPLVYAALTAGAIDRPKAWVFAEQLDGDLTRDQVAAICAALVPVAPRLTTGQLRARLMRMIHDIDPEHARRRYRRAVRERAVVGHLSHDGTVTVTATGLPADEAAVACERLDLLAGTVQRAGHPGRLAQIQADLFLGMLDGTFHHLTEAQIVAALLVRPRPEDVEPQGTDQPASRTAARADATSGTGRARGPATAHPAEGAALSGAAEGTAARQGSAADGSPSRDAATGGSGPGDSCVVRPGVEIRVGLPTLIGLDDRCGEVAGLGPVLPAVARALVSAQLRGAQWRFAVVDAGGHLILAGTTRRRPIVARVERRRCRGGVVELSVHADVLALLAVDSDVCGHWAAVVADIARQYAARDDGVARLDGRPAARFARAALARHVEVRDRTCCFPGCRRPARRSHKDHTRDHSRGGGTVRHNIGPLCGRHHRLKTEGGWVLAQPEPGRFRWTSPLGCIHHTRGEPITPPTVAPLPRPVESDPDIGSGRYVEGSILDRPTPSPAPLTLVRLTTAPLTRTPVTRTPVTRTPVTRTPVTRTPTSGIPPGDHDDLPPF